MIWTAILNFPLSFILWLNIILILKVCWKSYITHGGEHLLLLRTVIFGCDFILSRGIFSVLFSRLIIQLLLQFLFLIISFKYGVVIFVNVAHGLLLKFQLLELVGSNILRAELLILCEFAIYFGQFQSRIIHIVLYYWGSWRRFLNEIRKLIFTRWRTLLILILATEVFLAVMRRLSLDRIVSLWLLGLSIIDFVVVTEAIALQLFVAIDLLSL